MTTQDYRSKPTLFVDTEDSRRSGFVDMLLNIYADTIPSSENEKRQTTMMSCVGKFSNHLYIFQDNVTRNLACG
jgi:hypothetical protein